MLDGVKGTSDQDARARKVPRRLKKAASGKASARARSLLCARGIAECPLVSHVGDQRGLNNTRQVPAARAFVSDQTGLVEERRDGRDLSHLCCFASRTQRGSSGALTRHRLLHFRFVCTPLIFQRSYSALVASACAQVVARAKGRQTRPSARVVRAGGHRVVFIKRRS